MKKTIQLLRSKWREYLIEIVVIIVGILLAIALNNWNTERQDRQKEKLYIQQLTESLSRDTSLLNNFFLKRFDRKLEGLNLAKSYYLGSYQPKDTLTFLQKVSLGASFGDGLKSWNHQNVYKELINTGQFNLIEDESLRKSIISYYSSVELLTTRSEKRVSGYLNFINSTFPYNYQDPNFIDKKDQVNALVRFKREEFYYITNLEITFAYDTKRAVLNLKNRATDILTLISNTK